MHARANVCAEISGANGPRQLHALVLQFGPSLSQRHLAAALSRLAGYATKPPPRAARPPAAHARTRRHSVSGAGKSPGSALDDEDEEGGDEEADGGDDGGGGGGGGASGDGLYGGSQMSDGELFPLLEASARRCASVLLLRSGQGRLEPMPTATAVYALGRVRVHNRVGDPGRRLGGAAWAVAGTRCSSRTRMSVCQKVSFCEPPRMFMCMQLGWLCVMARAIKVKRVQA